MAYKYLWGSLFIIIGIFLAFFGRKLFTTALFIAAAAIFVGLVLIIVYSTFLAESDKWVGWIVISVAILLGLGVGYLATKLEKIGACLLAGWGGFCLGILLNESVLYYFGSAVLLWIVNGACALIAAIAAWFLFNQAIIISTAFVGSYLTMRGIGLYAGGFPNEYVLLSMIQTGDY